MKNEFNKMPLIISGVGLALVLMFVVGIFSSQNKAISYEESVQQAKSDINVQEKRRVDLVYNLADCVKQYDSHESDTLTKLAENMSKGNSVEDVNTSIAAVAYQYPKLKSNENYKELMNELSTTENLIAQYRENYNQSVTKYNRYIKKFPTSIFLDMTGYEKQEFERTAYEAPEDAPQDLFGE